MQMCSDEGPALRKQVAAALDEYGECSHELCQFLSCFRQQKETYVQIGWNRIKFKIKLFSK